MTEKVRNFMHPYQFSERPTDALVCDKISCDIKVID